MGHIALYREWRPKTFEEVVEQKFTVSALKQAVISDSIAHAYLFSGTRGTGKTTMAQVFSRAINCLAPENGNPCNKCKVCLGILDNTILDVIEMDAASNNNVDTIRRLCDEIVFSPSIARFKVYIIDEVHMLSTGAFNALLKTLEEPPSHAVFILATTEQHRIPATILSRCQRYEFRRITVASIIDRLLKICEEEKISATDEALSMIAKLSDGALRDAISLLDQARSAFPANITKEDVLSLVGLVNDEFMYALACSIADNAPDKGLELVEELILEGRDIIKFTSDLALYFRNVMLCHVCRNPETLINYPKETIEGMHHVASKIPLDRVITIIKELSSLVSDLRWSSSPRITFEIAMIRIMDFGDIVIESKPADAGAGNKNVTAAKKAEKTEITKNEENSKIVEIVENVEKITSVDDDSDTNETDSTDFDPFLKDIPFDDIDEASFEEESSFEESAPSDPFIGEQEQSKTVNLPQISVFWPKFLDSLVNGGQMTLYLFMLPAKPSFVGEKLIIEFEDSDEYNCKEVSVDSNVRIISDIVFSLLNQRLQIVVKLVSDGKNEGGKSPESSDASLSESDSEGLSDGINALKRSAEDLGIAFYMEE